jgi:hypothetical protein
MFCLFWNVGDPDERAVQYVGTSSMLRPIWSIQQSSSNSQFERLWMLIKYTEIEECLLFEMWCWYETWLRSVSKIESKC